MGEQQLQQKLSLPQLENAASQVVAERVATSPPVKRNKTDKTAVIATPRKQQTHDRCKERGDIILAFTVSSNSAAVNFNIIIV
jgi:hypothetical protein